MSGSDLSRTGPLLRAWTFAWRHRRWWLGPLAVATVLFLLLWLSERDRTLPTYIYEAR